MSKLRCSKTGTVAILAGALCLLAAGLSVRQAIRRPAPGESCEGLSTLLYSKCVALAGALASDVTRVAVLFAHHNDDRFSLPMASEMARISRQTPSSTLLVIVTPEPDTLAANIQAAPEGVTILGGDWLDFAPRVGNKLILPALILLREPGDTVLQWVGDLDNETLTAVLETFSSGADPEIPIPGEGDPIPDVLRDTLGVQQGARGTGEAGRLVLLFADPSCDACGPYLDTISEEASGANVRCVVVTSTPFEQGDRATVASPVPEIILDPDLALFTAMRVTVVPTLILVAGDGSIAVRVDGAREKTILDGAFAGFWSGGGDPPESVLLSPPIPPQGAMSTAGKENKSIVCYFFVSLECGSCEDLLAQFFDWPLAVEFFAAARAIMVFEDMMQAETARTDLTMRNVEVVCDRSHELLAFFGVVNTPTVVCVEGDRSEILRWSVSAGCRAKASEEIALLFDRIERECHLGNSKGASDAVRRQRSE